MNTLIILRGLPGSGKSTLAQTLKQLAGAVVCSVDEYFTDADGHYTFHHLENHKAYAACQAKARAAMEAQCPLVIIDHTNTMEWEMKPFFDLADELHYRVHVFTAENRHDGKSIHDIPVDQLEKMKMKFKVVL